MNINQLESQFSAMGARFKSQVVERHGWVGNDYVIDIQRDRHGPFFELRLFRSLESQMDVSVLQVCPRERHLLLLVRRQQPERTLDRFLCGHDEREWFVAAVPGRVSSVAQAKESLKRWRRMQRDAAVYARGEIRHPDHRTITLPVWHRVLMNTETRSRTMSQVAFLD